jgi:hypothetical protein
MQNRFYEKKDSATESKNKKVRKQNHDEILSS